MILCVGTTPAVQRSMVFSRLKLDSVNRSDDVQQYASGKSINAARVLHTLGHAVFCSGFVGGDSGQFLLNDLDQSDIQHSFVRVDAPSRVCITVLDQSAGTATELIEEARMLPAYAYEQLLLKFDELLKEATAVLLSGSLPPSAPADFYAKCISACTAAGKTVVLDAVGEPLRQALASKPTVIKPNRQELSQTVSAPVDTEEEVKSAIRLILGKGPQWAVITNGAKETIASDGKKFWKISTPSVKVISPIGSGDSFAAGLTAGLAVGLSVPDACSLAAACGSANAMTARAGFVNYSDVELVRSQVIISEY